MKTPPEMILYLFLSSFGNTILEHTTAGTGTSLLLVAIYLLLFTLYGESGSSDMS